MKELIYATIALIALGLIFFILKKRWKTKTKVNFALIIAFVLIFFGLFFNDKPAIGYSLLTLGAVIAIVERILSKRNS